MSLPPSVYLNFTIIWGKGRAGRILPFVGSDNREKPRWVTRRQNTALSIDGKSPQIQYKGMLKNIVYDHAYTLDKNHHFLKELQKLGFKLEPRTVEHPGKAFCRFIMFADPKKNQRQYLEFVDVRDKTNERKHRHAGLSFRFLKGLEGYYKNLKKKKDLHPRLMHKNYEWKKNNKDHLPGWNFMHFKNLPTRTIYPWFTEYEPSPQRKKSFKKSAHPNGAYEVAGLRILATPKVLIFFSRILGVKIKDQVTLKNGVRLFFKPSSVNRLDRILVRVKSVEKFEKFIGKSKLKIERTGQGFLIKNPHPSSRMYDLEIIP